MDLSNLRPIVTTMEVIHPTFGDTGIVLSLIGQDTKVFRDKAKSIAKSVSARKNEKVDLDALEAQNLELVANCIVGWTGLTEGGVDVEFTPQKALQLISDPELNFMKLQVEEFIAERKNFFRQPGAAA